MKGFFEDSSNPSISLNEARKVLGTLSKGMKDDELQRLINKMEILTDVVVHYANDSKFQSFIVYHKREADTKS